MISRLKRLFVKNICVEDQINLRLKDIPKKYDCIAKQGMKYIANNSKISDDNSVSILHRPWIAKLNWGLILYASVNESWFKKFLQKTNKEIPEFYKEFLSTFNGAYIYGLNFYGLTPSMYTDGVLDRRGLQCLDLTSANINWIREYSLDINWFHFGSRYYSDEENLGYFSDGNNKIVSVLKSGKVFKKWENFEVFLENEVSIVEKMMLEKIPNNIGLIKN